MTTYTKQQLEDFHAYKRVQISGRFNMLDPCARLATGLGRAEYGFVLDHYDGLAAASQAPAQYSDIVSDGGMDPRNAAPHTVHDQGELTFTESEYEPNRFTIGLNGKWFMSIQHNGEQLVERQRANMRRLVACWNACQGTSTESLEQNGVVDFHTVAEANKVVAATTEALKAQLRALEANNPRTST